MVTPDENGARGACYGFGIRSKLELNYLRSGSGTPLDVVTGDLDEGDVGPLLREWVPPLLPHNVRLYEAGAGFRLWIEEAGWFGIEPDVPRITAPVDGDPVRREERVWGLPSLLCFRARGDVPLHAACVEIEGRALLMAAPGRFGKTTLAAAFAAAGFRVLAEDLSCVRPGNPPCVIPGPAMIRLRRDVVDLLQIPGARELGRSEERAHLSLEGSRGNCDPVPIAGVVMLLNGDTEPVLAPAEGADVVRDLWAVSFRIPTDEDRSRSFQAVGALAPGLKAWKLTRRLRPDALRPSVDCLVKAVTRGS